MGTVIGISTYNGLRRIRNLLSSIYNYTYDEDLEDLKIVVVDDGTPNKKIVDKLEIICDHFQVHLLKHGENRGISAAWNTATKAFDVELIVLLNDDIQICHSSWLKAIEFFLESNKFAGSVSLPIFHIDPRTGLPREGYSLPNIQRSPVMKWTPGGQAFAFRREIYDKTGGFNEALPSFYEECDFGYEMASRGYPSYFLPFPPVQHWGSQTFALNRELSFCIPNPNELSLEQYRKILSPKFPIEKIEPQPGKAYRMEYSRVLFALDWGCKDFWDKPQNEVEEQLKDKKKFYLIKWLNKDEDEREKMII